MLTAIKLGLCNCKEEGICNLRFLRSVLAKGIEVPRQSGPFRLCDILLLRVV